MIHVLVEDVRKGIDAEIEALKNAICEGTMTHDQYTNVAGVIRGLVVAKHFIEQSAQKFIEE